MKRIPTALIVILGLALLALAPLAPAIIVEDAGAVREVVPGDPATPVVSPHLVLVEAGSNATFQLVEPPLAAVDELPPRLHYSVVYLPLLP